MDCSTTAKEKQQFETIVIYVDCIDRLKFFTKLGESLETDGHKIIYMAMGMALTLRLRLLGKNAQPIRKTNRLLESLNGDLKTSMDVINGRQDLKLAAKVFSATYQTLDEIQTRHQVSRLFIWNGTMTTTMAMTQWAKERSLPTRYFEFSNLPGKIFVDDQGVNAQSSLFGCAEVLDKYHVDAKAFKSWQRDYNDFKLKPPPQTKFNGRFNWLWPINMVGYWFLGCEREDRFSLFGKIKSGLKRKSITHNYHQADLEKRYIFLPLQVSNDSQINLNSDVDNHQAIRIASQESRAAGVTLYVKLHPAEPNTEFVAATEKLCAELNCLLVGNNTVDLINKAQKVIVINSTVGMEALLLNKEVSILGRALYRDWDYQRLSKFIMGFLVNIEYFEHSQSVPRLEARRAAGLT
jgi:capsular polysaccharide export protein